MMKLNDPSTCIHVVSTHNFQAVVPFSLLVICKQPSNREQVANLLCAQANLASYPQWDGK